MVDKFLPQRNSKLVCGVISRKLLIKSRNQNIFPIFKMSPTHHLIPFPMIYSLLGSVSSFENYWGGGGGAPHHLNLLCPRSKFARANFDPRVNSR